MDIILWRHAEAEEGTPDLARALTPKGLKQAALMAKWLKRYVQHDASFFVSPAKRTLQTADALGRSYETKKELAPDRDAEKALAALGWPDAAHAVVVVGHQPMLGQMASLLLTGVGMQWTMKKGAVWWLSERDRDGSRETILVAAMEPGLLQKKKKWVTLPSGNCVPFKEIPLNARAIA